MSILNDIRKGDLISILEFNTDVIVWDIKSEEPKTIYNEIFNNFEEPFGMLGVSEKVIFFNDIKIYEL